MQQQRPENVVRERALVRDRAEFGLVVWVRLDAQGGGEHELADGGAEAGEEGVEGLERLLASASALVIYWRRGILDGGWVGEVMVVVGGRGGGGDGKGEEEEEEQMEQRTKFPTMMT